MHLLALSGVLDDLWRSLREAFFMLWETLWALILGFTLSGIVQAFVSKERMQAALGTRSPKAVGKAAGFGMVSSSCSYAASAMSKSLFAKGADFITAMVFMFASTNLVLELGLVLLVLMGWQFMAAEFVGGPIMILLLVTVGGLFITAPLIAKARKRVAEAQSASHSHVSAERQAELEADSWSHKLRSPAAWSDASNYAVADVTMLRKELAIGYLVAGFLAVLVPTEFWNSLFLQGHGIWTDLENALVGPIIAVIAWVCSVGNVPLAAALWSGGISFGGVISFIFADLIAMPLIFIYAKFYGWKMTVRLVALFYVVMVAAGLVTQAIFGAAGLIPEHGHLMVMSPKFEWNYTTYLNLIFLVIAGGVWWLAKNRARFGGGVDYAVDPVCGMQVRKADAPATADYEAITYFFCADRCRVRFVDDPARFAHGEPDHHHHHDDAMHDSIDPVCGMSVDPQHAAATREFEGITYYFCNPGCAERFDADPARFANFEAIEPMGSPSPTVISLGTKPAVLQRHVDPICQMEVDPQHAAATREFEGTTYYFCNPGCAERFDEDPRAALEASAHHSTNRARE